MRYKPIAGERKGFSGNLCLLAGRYKASAVCPKLYTDAPKASSGLPKASDTSPKALDELPKASDNLPKASARLPKDIN